MKNNIRYYRKQADLSLRDCGARAQIPHSTLAALERGDIPLDADKIERLAHVLGVPGEQLVVYEPRPELEKVQKL